MPEAQPVPSRSDAVCALVRQHQDIGSNMYDLARQREKVRARLLDRIKDLFGPTGIGMTRLTLGALAVDGTRFALVGLDGRRQGITYSSRLEVTTFCVVRTGDRMMVFREQDGESVGQFGLKSLHRTFSHDAPELWTTPGWKGAGAADPQVLLPLSSCALEHARFRRQAAFAEAALGGDDPDFAELRDADQQMDGFQARQDAIQSETLAVATAGFDLEELDRNHAALIKLMNGHDWSWKYSDQFIQSAADCEREMIGMLAGMPPDEAIAVWHRHRIQPISYLNWPSVLHLIECRRDRRSAIAAA